MSIIEIDKAGLSLSIKAGFVYVKQADREDRIALDEVDCLVLNSYGAILSNHVLSRLCELNIPLLVCGSNANPIGILLSSTGNVYRKERVEKQLNISVALQRNLWQQIIKAKLVNQAKVLALCGKKHLDVKTLTSKVRSGDEGNAEAIGARIYWQRLFGTKFKRNPDLPGINAYLNYGYAVLRAAFCRSIVASGLIPELGIHHRNAMNPFCLADDLMEPYRPFIDRIVYNLIQNGIFDLNPEIKRSLIDVLELPISIKQDNLHLKTGINHTVHKLVTSLSLKKACLEYPCIDA
jgi:CRISPR-associated protein Cas1